MKRLCSVNTAFASAQRGEDTFYSEWLPVGSLHELIVLIDVTAVSGSGPKLNGALQTSPNASLALDHTALTQMSGASTQVKPVTNFGKFVRLKIGITGSNTPTFTFSAYIVAKS